VEFVATNEVVEAAKDAAAWPADDLKELLDACLVLGGRDLFRRLVAVFGLTRTRRVYAPGSLRGPAFDGLTDAEKALLVRSMRCAPHVEDALGVDGSILFDGVRLRTVSCAIIAHVTWCTELSAEASDCTADRLRPARA